MDAFNEFAALQKRGDTDEPWPERSPLPSALPKAPSMTDELAGQLLPEAIREWALDVAQRMQSPIEAVAVASLGSLASVVGRKIGIFPKRHDSFWVPCVVWTAIVARSGERKSSIISQAQRPLEKLEAKAREEFKRASAAAGAKGEMRKQKIEYVKDRIKVATKAGDLAKLSALENEFESLLRENEDECVAEVRYRTNDATVEKLGELLRSNPAGILHVRDELIGWLRGFDRPGREGDRAFFLEGWDASGAPFSVDRIGRGRVVVDSLCLQVMGGIQPGALEEYVRQAVSGGGGDDGFLQRFQLMVFPEQTKTIEWIDRVPNREAFERVQLIFDRLAVLPNLGARGEQRGLRFDSEAQKLYREWSVELERRFRLSEDEHPAFVSHLAKYLRLMPALALLFCLTEGADKGAVPEFVGLIDAQRSAALCEFLEAHARKVYAIVEKCEIRDAESLRRRIERGDIKDGMSVRDIARKGWTPFGHDADAISRAVTQVLEPFGWARIVDVKPPVGRPSAVIRIHPELRMQAPDA